MEYLFDSTCVIWVWEWKSPCASVCVCVCVCEVTHANCLKAMKLACYFNILQICLPMYIVFYQNCLNVYFPFCIEVLPFVVMNIEENVCNIPIVYYCISFVHSSSFLLFKNVYHLLFFFLKGSKFQNISEIFRWIFSYNL